MLKLLFLAAIVLVVVRVMLLRNAQVARDRPRVPRQPGREVDELRSAHEVLGVRAGASRAEIRAAYQSLVQQYHPDRVADLGPELREVAERRTKEINAAYTTLKRG